MPSSKTLSTNTPGDRSVSPLISRKINEGLWPRVRTAAFLALTAGLAVFLAVNLNPTNSAFARLKQELLLYPLDPSLHASLAALYLSDNDLDHAETELAMAADLATNAAEKQEITVRLNQVRQSQAVPAQVQAEIGRWEKIVGRYPGYRDGYLQLAILYWRVYKEDKSKMAWQKAYYLDPNSETVRVVGQALGVSQ